MKLEEVLPALRAGKKIRQVNDICYYIYGKDNTLDYNYIEDGSYCPFGLLRESLLDDDWEIVE